jgi:hypothetical protein
MPDLAVSPGGARFHLIYNRTAPDWIEWVDYRSAEYPILDLWTGVDEINYGQNLSGYADDKIRITVKPDAVDIDEAAAVWCEYRPPEHSYNEVYFDSPTTVGLGTIVVDTEPDALDAPWSLDGPGGYHLESSGDLTLTGMPDGDYLLTWLPLPYWDTPDPVEFNLFEGTTETHVGTYHRYSPRIISIDDVAGDQGRNVRLSWQATEEDPGAVTGYMLYRRQDGRVAGDRLEGWDSIVWLPARGETVYNYVSPTLCDSTDAGICWSTFFVSALTADPELYWDSPPDSGYSVDNLHPDAPGGLAMPASNLLAWDPCPDHDFDYFTVYADEDEAFTDPVHVGYTTGTSLDVSGTSGSWLAVSATDENGNESELSTILFNSTSAGELPPAAFALRQNVPNPFNPSTSIGFELPKPATVTLTVFDPAGRRIRLLADDERFEAGRHALRWNGCDDFGAKLSTGVYLYRFETDGYLAMRKMTLVK